MTKHEIKTLKTQASIILSDYLGIVPLDDRLFVWDIEEGNFQGLEYKDIQARLERIHDEAAKWVREARSALARGSADGWA
jgi:hypothetical protein